MLYIHTVPDDRFELRANCYLCVTKFVYDMKIINHSSSHLIEILLKEFFLSIGLDPAFPLFEPGSKSERLNAGDADFVDVIHTDGGIFGYPWPLGHADFFPNGGIPLQPGCTQQELPKSGWFGVIGKAEYFKQHLYKIIYFSIKMRSPYSWMQSSTGLAIFCRIGEASRCIQSTSLQTDGTAVRFVASCHVAQRLGRLRHRNGCVHGNECESKVREKRACAYAKTIIFFFVFAKQFTGPILFDDKECITVWK